MKQMEQQMQATMDSNQACLPEFQEATENKFATISNIGSDPIALAAQQAQGRKQKQKKHDEVINRLEALVKLVSTQNESLETMKQQ